MLFSQSAVDCFKRNKVTHDRCGINFNPKPFEIKRTPREHFKRLNFSLLGAKNHEKDRARFATSIRQVEKFFPDKR